MLQIDDLIIRKIFKYCLAGVVNTFIGYFLIFLALYGFKWGPFWSNAFGYGIGFSYGYLLHKKIIFKNEGNYRREWFYYAAVFLISYFSNLTVLHLLINYYKFNVALSQILAGTVYVISSFTLYNVWVFKNRPVKMIIKENTL